MTDTPMTSQHDIEEQKGYFITQEVLGRSHDCNERCDLSRLEHYVIPTIPLNVIKWTDFEPELSNQQPSIETKEES